MGIDIETRAYDLLDLIRGSPDGWAESYKWHLFLWLESNRSILVIFRVSIFILCGFLFSPSKPYAPLYNLFCHVTVIDHMIGSRVSRAHVLGGGKKLVGEGVEIFTGAFLLDNYPPFVATKYLLTCPTRPHHWSTNRPHLIDHKM